MQRIFIRQVRLLDGSGAPWQWGNILIEGSKILAMGHTEETADLVIEGKGNLLVPGFIDLHTHADRGILEFPLAENYLRQGVTTLIGGNCGGSAYPIKEHKLAVEQQGIAINYGLLVGHGSIRQAVMGMEMRHPTPNEQTRMQDVLAKALEDGALGMSLGLYYTPGSYAKTDEVVGLAKVVAQYHGFVSIHMRDESDYNIGLLASIEEAIEIARKANVAVQISHLKCLGRSVWGQSKAALTRLEQARDEGLDVSFDQYPYIASGTSLTGALIPGWVQAGGREEMLSRFLDDSLLPHIHQEVKNNIQRRGGAESLVVAHYAPEPTYNGWSLAKIASFLELDEVETTLALLKQGGVQIVSFNMLETDVETIMRHPLGMIGSDGSLVAFGEHVPHPRYYGTFPRVLAHYVAKGVISFAEAIRRMTSAPAARLGLWNRGLLRPGMQADLLLLNEKEILDTATYECPHAYPKGIEWVMVGGKMVLFHGEIQNRKAGTFVHRG